MRRTAALSWWLPLGASLLACSASVGPTSDAWVPDSTSTVLSAPYTSMSDARLVVISDAATWQQTWAQIYAILRPQPPVPAVDFSAHGVVLAALGQRPSGGFSIVIDSVVHSVVHSVGQDAVYVTNTAPGSGCVVTQAITAPVTAVVTPWPLAAVQWHTRSVTDNCM